MRVVIYICIFVAHFFLTGDGYYIISDLTYYDTMKLKVIVVDNPQNQFDSDKQINIYNTWKKNKQSQKLKKINERKKQNCENNNDDDDRDHDKFLKLNHKDNTTNNKKKNNNKNKDEIQKREQLVAESLRIYRSRQKKK